MRRAEFEAQRESLLRRYHAAKDLSSAKLAANSLIQLYDEYIKSCRFAMAKAFSRIEELEQK